MNVDVFHAYALRNLTDENLPYTLLCETSLLANTPASNQSKYFAHINNVLVPVGSGKEVTLGPPMDWKLPSSCASRRPELLVVALERKHDHAVRQIARL